MVDIIFMILEETNSISIITSTYISLETTNTESLWERIEIRCVVN